MADEKPEFTVEQIKRMLKPMADFAPAFLSGIKILESFEAAQKGLAEHEKNKKELLSQINALERDKQAMERDVQSSRAKESQAKTDLGVMEGRVQAATDELNGLGAQLSVAKGLMEKDLEQYAEHIRIEKHALDEAIRIKRNEQDQAEKAFAKWRKEHGL